jgi:DNA polymerase-1
MRLIFDIESDSLLDDVTKIHCLVAKDIDTGEVYVGTDHETILSVLQFMAEAEVIIGHNIISFDIPVIRKLYPSFEARKGIFDTLVASRLIYSNIVDRDMAAINSGRLDRETFKVWNKEKKKEESAIGRHSLEAWGLRLGNQKGDFGRHNDWSTFTPEMLEYCKQDVEVTHNLFKIMEAKNYSERALDLEMEVQVLIFCQERTGWQFDVKKAQALYADLLAERVKVESEISKVFEGWYTPMKKPEYYFVKVDRTVEEIRGETKKDVEDKAYQWFEWNLTPKKRSEIKEMIQAGPVKQKYTPFLPNSRQHIARAFREKYGWQPKQFNEDGTAKCDAVVLRTLPYPEAQLLLRYEVLQDRIEKLAEGRNGGWLDRVKNGRIHGYCNPLGTVTFRGTHGNPNLAQVPAKGKEYGAQCRELFTAKPGMS